MDEKILQALDTNTMLCSLTWMCGQYDKYLKGALRGPTVTTFSIFRHFEDNFPSPVVLVNKHVI